MDRFQIQAFTLTLRILVLLAIAVTTTAAERYRFETLTSFKAVRSMEVIGDSLYVATSGGLLVIDDATAPGSEFIHTDGLGTTDLRDITVDTDGAVWLAGNGRLIRFNPLGSQRFLFFDSESEPLELYSVVDDGDELWVGAEIGLVLFSKIEDGGQIQDSYTLYGDLNPSPIVFDIELLRDTIWLATSSGLAAAPTADPVLLKSPSVWTTYDVSDYPGLGSDTIRQVEVFGSDIYVATSQGAFRLEQSAVDTQFVAVGLVSGVVVNDLVTENDTMFLYHVNGVSVVTATDTADLVVTGVPVGPVTGTVFEGLRWVGAGDSGIFVGAGSAFEEYPYTGSPGNTVRSIGYGPGSMITAGFRDKVYAQFDGSIWKRRAFNAVDGAMDVLVDPMDRVWAASWGSGLWLLGKDTLVNYDERNSTLSGVFGSASYVVVRSLATDGEYLYASLFQAANNDVVAFVPLDEVDNPNAWGSYGTAEGLTNDLVTTLAVSNFEFTVGTLGIGVYRCRIDGSECTHYTEDNSRLLSNSVRVVEYSPFGNVWVGTNLGVSRWDDGIERFVDVTLPPEVSTDVTSLAFDGLGNIWVGTRSGLARLDVRGGASLAFTETNSDLVADQINDLWLDRATRDLYIATAGGISIIQTQVDNFTTELGSVVAVPNPYVIRSSDEVVTFNFDAPGTVKVYTVAGEPVAEFPVNESWDGRNQSGRAVASGVYLFVVTASSGETHRGKLLLVRE